MNDKLYIDIEFNTKFIYLTRVEANITEITPDIYIPYTVWNLYLRTAFQNNDMINNLLLDKIKMSPVVVNYDFISNQTQTHLIGSKEKYFSIQPFSEIGDRLKKLIVVINDKRLLGDGNLTHAYQCLNRYCDTFNLKIDSVEISTLDKKNFDHVLNTGLDVGLNPYFLKENNFITQYFYNNSQDDKGNEGQIITQNSTLSYTARRDDVTWEVEHNVYIVGVKTFLLTINGIVEESGL